MSAGFYDVLEDDEPWVGEAVPAATLAPVRVYASGLGVRADRVILAKLDEIRRAGGRYQNRGAFLETSADGSGFYLERGGVWNDTSGRIVAGSTKADVADVRAGLRAIGVTIGTDAVENILTHALRVTSVRDTLSKTENMHLDVKEYWKAQRRARIAKLREAGLCTMCGKESVAPDRSTCSPCGTKANARKKRAG